MHLVHGYVNKMKLDKKRTRADVLKRMERECYTVIPRDIKAEDVTPLQIKIILSGIIQRDAAVHANRVRSYLMTAFNQGLKADNDPMNNSVGFTFGLEVNPVSAIPKRSQAEKVGDTLLTLEELRVVMEQFAQATNVGPLMQHLIPLTESALQELASVKELTKESNSPYIFPLTFKTLMGEVGISKEIRDSIQNHALNDVSSKHCDRYEYLTESAGRLRSGRIGLTTISDSRKTSL